jgi:two-component system sensor histidine kinase CreC
MRLRSKLLLTFSIAVLATHALFIFSIQGKLRQGYAQNIEDILVDASQLLASVVEEHMRDQGGVIDPAFIAKIFEGFKKKTFNANIFALEKTKPALGMYLTDSSGTVLYSSDDVTHVGDDLSLVNDVRQTLKGSYGARSTRRDPTDRWSSVFYVASPIKDDTGKIKGVVSVIKHREDAYKIVKLSLADIVTTAFAITAVVIAFGLLLFLWLTHPLEILRRYTLAVTDGKDVYLPKLGAGEVAELGGAFEDMRIALEGKKSVEQLTQLLTHELKSPLTAILGAAELASIDGISVEQRHKLLENIIEQSDRTKMIVERLLQVAALEVKKDLDVIKSVDLQRLVQELRKSLLSILTKKQITLEFLPGVRPILVQGDPFLIEQCIRNLLQNAIDFSPYGSTVKIEIEHLDTQIRIDVIDEGPGIPEFARPKIFEKFFSMERADSKRRGTGLGLNLVKEVMHLHRGSVILLSPVADHGGTIARLSFPV